MEFMLSLMPAFKAKGFTLIELLIVIAIMGILAAAVLVAINPLKRQQQARDASRKSDLGQIASALQAYSTSPGNGQYPTANGAATLALTWLTASGDLKRIPNDPNGSWNYSYTVTGTTVGNDAAIYATMESPTGANGFWCWKSGNGVATEVTNATAANNCTP